jgi:hypothetical protein
LELSFFRSRLFDDQDARNRDRHWRAMFRAKLDNVGRIGGDDLPGGLLNGGALRCMQFLIGERDRDRLPAVHHFAQLRFGGQVYNPPLTFIPSSVCKDGMAVCKDQV